MFTRSARFYDSLYAFKDYAAAAARLHQTVRDLHPEARSLLDLACGTGRHLEHLRPHYAVEGLDIEPAMLELARERNPDVPLHRADMADFDLGRRFDVVTCLFSSIGYVRTAERLRSTVAAMARHLEPGGLVLLEPWFTPDQYWVGRITANHVDQPDLKIAWMYVSERHGGLSVFDIHYLVGTPDGIERFRERHEMGLFTGTEYEEAFRAAGLDVEHDPAGFFGRGLYTSRAGG